ncbi:hypothetical protein [Gilvibacter sediminis]|uniref:hypothetical protein n=1 Tax=Gilvibacter sediminis TaxID=379071 RepID=UPI00234FC89F|nr:hypothetical protein [Gilvibacter sediminis]MDC7999125.1 hypothetical protein [Gilvibacter sediminis]
MSKKVLITSIGRTATLSLTQWLNQISGVQAYHERGKEDPFFLYLSQFKAYTEFTQQYLSQRDALSEQSAEEIYVEVNPYFRFADRDFLKDLGWIKLFLVRHPRTYLESVYRRKLFTTADTSFQKLPEPNDDMYKQWKESSRFQKLCWYYTQVHQYVLKEQYTYFRSEALIKNRPVQEEFLNAIGLEHQTEIPDFPHLNQSNSGMRGETLDWSALTSNDLETYEELCKPLIVKLGYELS